MTLLALAFIGGSIGALIAMYGFPPQDETGLFFCGGSFDYADAGSGYLFPDERENISRFTGDHQSIPNW